MKKMTYSCDVTAPFTSTDGCGCPDAGVAGGTAIPGGGAFAGGAPSYNPDEGAAIHGGAAFAGGAA